MKKFCSATHFSLRGFEIGLILLVTIFGNNYFCCAAEICRNANEIYFFSAVKSEDCFHSEYAGLPPDPRNP